MKNSALREDDAAYVESFADSLRSEKSEEQSDPIIGQMLTFVLPLLKSEHKPESVIFFIVILVLFLIF